MAVPAPATVLDQNYPNPFNPATTIRYYLPRPGPVTLDVYDVSGKRIVRLIRTYQFEGNHSVGWNGLDGRGAPVSSGAYLSVLTAGGGTISRKMILIR